MLSDQEQQSLRRWRLILGKDSQLNNQTATTLEQQGQQAKKEQNLLSQQDQARDQALDYLYRREYQQRGDAAGQQQDRQGGRQKSSITPARWLAEVRKVFPKSTVDVLQNQAINRYQMQSLLSDVKVLKQATANLDLVQTLLSFKNHLQAEVMSEVRRIIQQVCQQLEETLWQKVTAHFSSRRLRHLLGGKKQFRNLDWSSSIRRNLKNYHADEDALILERLYFYQRQENKIPWNIYLLIDQSGSMLDSIIHTAVLAAIFCRVRALHTRLILFDTTVVDLGSQLSDPVDTLLSVQLGGGTDIAYAINYVATLISQPARSLVILISDFEEGGDPYELYQQTQILQDSGVTLLGLAALNEQCDSAYNETIAQGLSDIGMSVAAMTPDHLAAWVAEKIS